MDDNKEYWVECHLSKNWWKRPIFDFSGIHMPAPYIWFGYWLITWMDFDKPCDDTFHWKNLRISFLPD